MRRAQQDNEALEADRLWRRPSGGLWDNGIWDMAGMVVGEKRRCPSGAGMCKGRGATR